MKDDLVQKKILLQDFKIMLDDMMNFFKKYPDDYVNLQKELCKAIDQNNRNLEYIRQTLDNREKN